MTSARYLFRRMFRAPGFSLMVIITIALAVGVNLGVFTITQSILLKSLGVPRADRLVYYTLGTGTETIQNLSGPAYEALRANAATRDVSAWQQNQFRLQTADGIVRVTGAYITGNGFSVFGLKPSLGRFFNEADDTAGGGRDGWAAVLGYSYWKTHFGASHNAIGRTITLDGVPVHVVGVLPQEFTGVSPVSPANILLPRHFQAVSYPGQDRFAKPGYFEWFVFSRLPNGTSMQGLKANLNAIEPWFRRAADPNGMMLTVFRNTPPGSLLNVHDGRLGAAFELEALRTPLIEIESLAGFVFLFCCCNLILLFIGRASREAQAAAIRMALGARLGNDVRFAMLEAAVLASIGCLIAAPIAWAAARIVSRAMQSVPGFDAFPTISPSGSLFLIAVGISLAVACLSGTGASIWNRRRRASISLKEGHGATAAHSRSWIVGFEVFATILLITAAVVGGVGFQKLSHQPSGFSSGNTVMASLDIKGDSPAAATGSAGGTAKQKMDRILSRIESSPGVQNVAMVNTPPLKGLSTSSTAYVQGAEGGVRQQKIWPADVSVQYFSAIGTKIVRGRGFTNDDLAGDTVCVLSSRAASVLFPGDNPLGKSLYQGGNASCQIVGVAEDAHFTSMSDPAEVVVYRLFKRQLPNIVVRAATSGLAIQAVRNAVQAIAPASLDPGMDTIQSDIHNDLRLWKVITLSGGLCACIAAIILGIGFFGILVLQVSERKREIGVQIALGANRTQVCVSVMKKLRRAFVLGLLLGSGSALLAAAKLAEVYSLSTQFVIGGYLGSLALLALLLVVAAAVPLRRALAVSPMECLSSE